MSLLQNKGGLLRRFAVGWPELFWLSVFWLSSLPLAWLRYQTNGVPYHWTTVVFYVCCLFCIIAATRAFGITSVSQNTRPASLTNGPFKPDVAFLVTSLAALAVVGLFYYLRRDYVGIDMSDMRNLRGEIELSGGGYRAYVVLAPLALASTLFAVASRQHVAFLFAYIAVFGFLFWRASIFAGARFELLPIPILCAVNIWLRYNSVIVSRPLRSSAIAGAVLGILVIMNTAYNLVGMRGGDESATALQLRNGGIAVLQQIGINSAPIWTESAIGSISEYLLSPLVYLDHYLQNDPYDPTWGTHQFGQIFVRLGLPVALPTKMAVDDLYSDLGVYNNVWATGLREMMIDFGIGGAILQCIVLGCLLGMSKRYMHVSLAAQNLYLLLVGFFFATPLVNLFKSLLFEAGFYGALLWFGFDLIRVRAGLDRPRLVRAAHSLNGTRRE